MLIPNIYRDKDSHFDSFPFTYSHYQVDPKERVAIPWYAKSVKGWSVEDVSDWLAAARMPHLQDTFARKKVDGPKLLKIGKTSHIAEQAKRYHTTRPVIQCLQKKLTRIAQSNTLAGSSTVLKREIFE